MAMSRGALDRIGADGSIAGWAAALTICRAHDSSPAADLPESSAQKGHESSAQRIAFTNGRSR